MAQIRVGGVYGVGKSTLIEGALRQVRTEHSLDVPLIKGSLIMAQILGVEPDRLPELPEAERHAARATMYSQIARMPNGVRDAHFSVTTENGGYEFPRSSIDSFCVGALVLVIAEPEAIAQRRTSLGRKHRSTNIADIAAHQEVEVAAAEALAGELGVSLYKIENSGPENVALQAMASIVRTHCSDMVPARAV